MRPRPRPRIVGGSNAPGTGGGVTKPPRRVSEEGRQRLSELARERHQNGGFTPVPGRPRRARKPSKARIAALVAQAAMEEKTAREIIEVFKDGIAPTQRIETRLKAAEAWLRVDAEQAKLEIKDAHHEEDRMEREDALRFLADTLSKGHAASLVRKRLEQATLDENGDPIIDADPIDESDAA